jgi:hypothetical protein
VSDAFIRSAGKARPSRGDSVSSRLFELFVLPYPQSEIGISFFFCRNPAPGLVFTRQWQFNARRGAVMVMHKPRSSTVPKGFFDEALKRRFPALKGKSVIYEVYSSPGFFMYLSNKSEYCDDTLVKILTKFKPSRSFSASEQVTISLHANLNRPTPGANNPPQAPFIWSSQGTPGICHHVYRASGSYSPLFALRSVRRPLLRRDEMNPSGLGRET